MHVKPVVVACPGANGFAQKVAKRLGTTTLPVRYTKFLNGEVKAEVLESVRDRDVFVFQDVANKYEVDTAGGKELFSLNDHFMALVATVDALNWCDVKKITLVLPSFPYARQHVVHSREPLMARAVCDVFHALKVSNIITIDIHSESILGYARPIKTENVKALAYLLRELKSVEGSFDDYVVVAPDSGAIGKSKYVANILNLPLRMVYKERDYTIVTHDSVQSNIKGVTTLGDVTGKACMVIDDMIDSGSTLLNVCRELKKAGAKKTSILASLPFFNGGAVGAFSKAYEEGVFGIVVSTNAVLQQELLLEKWYHEVDVSPLVASVVERVYEGKSVSDMLDSSVEILKL